ncbi:hypothetical protein AA700_0014 [Acidiphilium acidophilum DSM 700]|nr:hypothetical protein AA700_0014 [Acidiphilium acidophilum DSM 700]
MVGIMGYVGPFGSSWVSDPDCGESRDRKMIWGECSGRVLNGYVQAFVMMSVHGGPSNLLAA